MGHIFTYEEAENYDSWFEIKKNGFFFEIEKNIMIEMLDPLKNTAVIDIGCGTGKSIEPLIEKGLSVTGLEPSVYMLDIAKKRIGNKANFVKSVAEDIPFDDNYFNYSVFFFSLEFTQNPQKALSEAFRVTKDKVFVFIINKFSIYGILNSKKINPNGNFLSLLELKKMTHKFLGDVPFEYRTLSFVKSRKTPFLKKNPFAACIAATIVPLPKIKMRPMTLKSPSWYKSFSPKPALEILHN